MEEGHSEAQAKRFADGRNYYDAPCCTVSIGILEDATACSCPACGAMLEQCGIGLSLKARVHHEPPDFAR